MNYAPKEQTSNFNHWMLWVNPGQAQVKSLREWPEALKSRVLTMRPRDTSMACRAILTAIESGFYAMITLPNDFFCEMDEWKIKQSAQTFSTVLVWE